MIGSTAVSFLTSVLSATPLLIVLIVGLGIAATSWSRLPRIAPLVVTGLGLELLVTLLGAAYGTSFPFLVRSGVGVARIGLISLGVNIVLRLLELIAWICILIAIFSGRRNSDPAGRGE